MNLDSPTGMMGVPMQEFSVRLTLTLLHFVWQGCVIGVISAMLARGLRRRSARLRYGLDVTALLILAACLPVTLAFVEVPTAGQAFSANSPDASIEPPVPVSVSAVDELPHPTVEPSAGSVGLAGDPANTGAALPVRDQAGASAGWFTNMQPGLQVWLARISPYAAAFYFAGVLLMTLRLLVALRGGHRLRTSATPLTDPTLLTIARRQAERLGLRVTPLIAWCGRVSTPIVVGILKPAILLPGALATGLTPEEFSVLLTHELAHIRRYDLFVNLLQRTIEALLFFHPAVWSISRRVSRERENCCDDAVVHTGCSRIAYAETLVRMAELCLPTVPSMNGVTALAAAGGSRSEFKQRVLRLLSVEEPLPLRLSRFGVVILAATVGLGVVGPLLLQSGVLAEGERESATDDPAATTQDEQPRKAATESTIKVVLKLDREDFLLGESIAVVCEMTNTGDQPATYSRGGVYPALRINDGYHMTAVLVDENNSPTGRSAPSWPLPRAFDGPVGGWKLEPQGRRTDTLFVTRYIRFDEAGRYRLRVENVDRETGQAYAAGETILTLRQPTPEQARQVYEAKKRAPREAYRDSDMAFLAGAADFETMYQPVYLEILRDYASRNDLDALPSLERMERREANAVLVAQAARAMDEKNWDFVRACFTHLKPSLPFPNWYDEGYGDWNKSDRERVERTWSSGFGPTLTRVARGLTAQLLASGVDPKSIPSAEQERWQSQLRDIDYIYRCVGQPKDFADCLRAYTISIQLTRTLPFETHQYFRPRGSAYGFMHSVFRMLKRGVKPPLHPADPGEAAAYLLALRTQPEFRPAEWPDVVVKWFRYGIDDDLPYLSELVLDDVPAPVPQPIFDAIPEALAHPYIDLQIAACKFAERYPREAYHEPLRKLLRSAEEEFLVKFATSAGLANGIQLVPPRGAVSEMTLPDHLNVMAVAYAEDDSALVSVATEHDVSIRFWGTAGEEPRTVKLESDRLFSAVVSDKLRLSADGSTLVAAPEGRVQLWSTRTGQLTSTLSAPGNAYITALALTPDGSKVAGATTSNFEPGRPWTTYVWDVKTGQLSGQFTHSGGVQIHDVALSADGRFLASASQEAGTMIWDLKTGERLYAIANDNTGREHPAGPLDRSAANQVLSLAFSPDGSVLATADMFGVKLYGIATGQLMRTIHAAFRYGRSALLFSPDGQRVARVAADKTVRVWKTETGECEFELEADSNCGAFSRDGRQLAVGLSDQEKALKVFELTRE